MIKNKFTIRKIYESRLFGKNYEYIRKIIEQENVRITNLIGINGIIHHSEFIQVTKKLN